MINQSTPSINHFSSVIKLDELSDSLEFIEDLGKSITNNLGLNVVKKIDNKFEPIGRTVIYILSESHLAIHTWPEYNILHIDLVSCKKTDKQNFDKVLMSALNEQKVLEFKSEFHEI